MVLFLSCLLDIYVFSISNHVSVLVSMKWIFINTLSVSCFRGLNCIYIMERSGPFWSHSFCVSGLLERENRLTDMERLNSKLYLQNCYIMKENERLRKKAQLLNQENQVLLSELKQKLSKQANSKAGAPNTILDLNLGSSSAQNASSSSNWYVWRTPLALFICFVSV